MKKIYLMLLLAFICANVFAQNPVLPVGVTTVRPVAADVMRCIDGDTKTLYESEEYANAMPDTLSFYFSGASSINEITYTPRNDGLSYGRWQKISVYHNTQADPAVYVADGSFTMANNTAVKTLNLAAAMVKPFIVRVVVTSAVLNESTCAEINFYSAEVQANQPVADCQNPTAEDFSPLSDVQVAVASAVANTFHDNSMNLAKSIDGNLTTFYQSKYSTPAFVVSDSNPAVLTYNFTGNNNIDLIKYIPRTGTTNGNFGRGEIWYATTTNATLTKLMNFDAGLSSSPSSFGFPQRLVNVTQIVLRVFSGVGNYASCAEMQFFKSNSIGVLTDIFADDLYSSLKPGVSQAQISAITSPFFKALAQCLYNRTYQNKFRVQNYKAYIAPSTVASALRVYGFSNFENPTGISFKANTKAVIFVGSNAAPPVLKVCDFATDYKDPTPSPDSYPLKAGLNVIDILHDGLGYISYYSNVPQADVKIHIATGEVNGYFDPTTDTDAEWVDYLNNNIYKYLDIKGKYIGLNFNKRALFVNNPQEGKSLINAYDKIVEQEYTLQGFFKYNIAPKNHIFARTVPTGVLLGGSPGALFGIYNGIGESYTHPNKLSAWGTAHEIGHVLQTPRGMEWIGMGETTNNIHSLYNQYVIGKEFPGATRYEGEETDYKDNKNLVAGRYSKYFANFLTNNNYYEAGELLPPFWQLELYYMFAGASKKLPTLKDRLNGISAPTTGPDVAYGLADIYQRVRQTSEAGVTDGQHMLNFVKYACDAFQEDLTDFFKEIGFIRPIDRDVKDYGTRRLTITQSQIDATITEVKAKNYPKPVSPVLRYISARSVNAFKDRLTVVGTNMVGVTLAGTKLNIDNSKWLNVVAFETYSGTNLIEMAIPGTGDGTNATTKVLYPAGATAVFAVSYDGSKKQVYPTEVVLSPVLAVAKTGPATLTAGNTASYTIRVTNTGLGNALAATIADNVPNSFNNVSWTSAVEGTATIVSGGTGTGNALSIQANIPSGTGNAVVVTVTGILKADATGNVSNTATAVPVEPGGTAGTSTVTSNISSTVGLNIIKTAPANANAGETINYLVEVGNTGPSDALGIKITDVVPAQLTNVSWSSSVNGTAIITTGSTGTTNNIMLLANIPAGATNKIRVTIIGTISPTFTGTLTNTAFATPAGSGSATVTGTASTNVNGTVTPGNHAPVVSVENKTGTEDSPASGKITASDPDGDPLTFSKASDPAHGAAIVNLDGTYTYTPNPDYNGPDSFTVMVCDGKGGTVTATINIMISAVNDVPVVNPENKTGQEDSPASGKITASDPDGDPLTFSKVSDPAHGTVIVNLDGNYTYTPNPDYNGPDSFTVMVSDGKGGTVTATVNISVSAVNDAPVVNPENKTGQEDSPASGKITASDPDGDPLTFSKVTEPAHGTVIINLDGTYIYIPYPDYNGADSFTVMVSDGKGGTITTTVNIMVSAVNDVPMVTPENKTSQEDSPASGKITASDADGDPLTFSKVTEPAHGTAIVNLDGTYIYIPYPDYNGADSFTVMVSDGKGGTITTTVSIMVSAVNDAPVVTPENKTSPEDSPASGKITASDPDGDPLTFSKATDPAHGTAIVNPDGNFTYTPNPDYNGPDSFTVTVSDGKGGTVTGMVNIIVIAVNDAPVVNPENNTSPEDSPARGKITASDADGDPLIFTKSTDPAHGKVVVNSDGTYTYTPNLNYNGSDSFTVTVNDGKGGITTITVNITISAVNDAPVATAPAITTSQNTPANGNITASDPDGDVLTYTLTTAPAHGTVKLNTDGNYIYTPTIGYTGSDIFTVTVNDGKNGIATVTIPVTVTLIPAPAITLVKTSVLNGNKVSYTFTIKNTGNVILDAITLTDAKIGLSNKVITVAGGLAPGTTTSDVEVYTLTQADKDLGTVTNTATVNAKTLSGTTVTDVSGTAETNNTATVTTFTKSPIAIGDRGETVANAPVVISVLANDDPGNSTFDKLSVEMVSQPKHGSVQANADGTVTYKPDPGYVGEDTFTYRVKDIQGYYTNAASVSLTIDFMKIKVPNLFTPNGDGINDTFEIIGLNQYQANELQIVNRSGNEVFHAFGYQNNWTGEGLSENTYYYLLRVKKADSEYVEVFKGYITLVRTFKK
ncbi:Ig-like domain-containing protein [Pedobacter roseus]|uniref:Tandem-95 repeat protein n=1 Tax=Pedobacter roseus TaxID=336820 RepID=A0A7G9QBU4_9SPHI|nr:Ig-like domain-containing protein [Pedobacter roseus]QNN40819.1 tandem-95 repeat protein [Pedobacter roseus]